MIHRFSRGGRAIARRSGERGVVLIWTAAGLLLIAGIIIAATDTMRAVDEMARVEFSASGQANRVAEAGLVDAYAWLRRQQVQPVDTFAPRLDLTADPAINETDDPSIGLVRTFEIAPGVWGRYEVRHGTDAEDYTDGNVNGRYDSGEAFTDADGDGAWTPARWTRDVSTQRGQPGAGAVWLLVSRGEVFQRSRADLELDEAPNRRVAVATIATEVRRLTIAPPASAAICARRGDHVALGSRARIRGKAAGVAHKSLTGLPLLGGAEVLAPVAVTAVPWYDDSVEAVFGVNWTQLKSMADLSTSDPTTVPGQIPDFTLVVVDADITFDADRPLRGRGIVVVKGDCTIESGSNTFYDGLLYVDGDFKARAPSYIRGTVIVTGRVDIRGDGGDYAEVEHDPSTIDRLLVEMGQYRYSKAVYVPGEAEGAHPRRRHARGGWDPVDVN